MGLFDFLKGSSLSRLHPLAKRILEETSGERSWGDVVLKNIPAGREFLELSKEEQAAVAGSLLQYAAGMKSIHYGGSDWEAYRRLMRVLGPVLNRKIPFEEGEVIAFVEWLVESPNPHFAPVGSAVKALEGFCARSKPSSRLKKAADRLRKGLLNGDADARRYASRISEAVKARPELPMVEGDVWADQAMEDLRYLESEALENWTAFLAHCQSASGGKPSGKWLNASEALLVPIPQEEFLVFVVRWFQLAGQAASESRRPSDRGFFYRMDPMMMMDINQDILKGVAWACRLVDDPVVPRAVSELCISAFKKVPGIGPRAIRLGNACINTLGAMTGQDPLAQLALVKVKVKNRSTQNQIQKALEAAAEREGVTTEELEEMSVPDYGLTVVGVLEEPVGDFTARLEIGSGNSTVLSWVKPDGRTQKTVPVAVKENHADEIKELRATAKDIQKMLPAIRERLDGLYLTAKSWELTQWRERYLDHPLTGHLARRLIWKLIRASGVQLAIWHENFLVDSDGNRIELSDEEDDPVTVELWHPLDSQPDEVLTWRKWLEEKEVSQPFKQAHREIYTLTEAEENTRVYSNRYAAHVLKQHQFNALCLARRWRNQLRLMVDDEYAPASRDLPHWGLRAEYWVEGIGGDYNVDTTDSGTYLYLSSDQVRFYDIGSDQVAAHASGGGYSSRWVQDGAEPKPLEEIPVKVFSEIMRDVDLFVGVSSVANDPNWSDGGPEGRYVDYWHTQSFGELTASAKTRKETLERLLPKLKIRDVARVEEKFLIVEGKIRTYKIHLGSGNILMAPNDRYLCIVPNASQRRGTDKIFLPFEGDNVMSIILSKAFLLAADDKIKDPTILSQIGSQ